MKSKFLTVILITASIVIVSEPEPLDLGILEAGIDYAIDALKDDPQTLFNPPTNDNNSIQYILYTEESKNEPCYIEPSADQFDKCSFNSSHETKFLIHGYVAKLPPDNRFNVSSSFTDI
ncbi:hypothetical protein AVEN_17255-1 [Araneus ventricosus]|uniref:Uncharacterized protein n=1 Tax=Araneus ventricosus TaxID=182803 RepID=A0A4Y2T5N6_ARAVE|nr:hypothetical protein AVEN_17255-1 [Araneus ventricosus]